jgi:hypothetical protein
MRKKPDFVPVTIRFPRELHGMLTQAAYVVSPANSFNREIVERLYSTFKKEDELDDLRVRLAALEAQMREGEIGKRKRRPRGGVGGARKVGT